MWAQFDNEGNYIQGTFGSLPPWGRNFRAEKLWRAEGWRSDLPDDWKPSVSITEQIIILRAKINTERNRREMGGFAYLDKVFDSDQTSVIRINAAVNTAVAAMLTNTEYSVTWTCADNTTADLNAQEFLGLAVALAQHSNTQHVRAREIKELLEEAQTEEDLSIVENQLNIWKAED